MTDQELHQYSQLHPLSQPEDLHTAVQALVEEARAARAAEAEGHRRMAALAEQLKARGHWTAFREHRIRQALQQPLRPRHHGNK